MAQPVLGPFAQRLYDDLAPMAYDDPNQGWALAHYINAIAQMMEDVDALIRDQDGLPGWSQAVDINRAPTGFLTWLGQFVGVSIDAGLTDAQQRQVIRNEGGFSRGTLQALVSAAQRYLTGTQTVIVRERYPGPYQLNIITYASETGVDYFYYSNIYAAEATYTNVYNDYGAYSVPYGLGGNTSNQILQALLAQKPAGIVLNYEVLAGQDYAEIWLDWPDYVSVYGHYGSYLELFNDAPRPHPFSFQQVINVLHYEDIWSDDQAYYDVWASYISY